MNLCVGISGKATPHSSHNEEEEEEEEEEEPEQGGTCDAVEGV
jgi:hypothetical protein